jgi:hypothetical protein
MALIAASALLSLLAVEAGLRLAQPETLRLFPRFHESVRYGPYLLRRTRPGASFEHHSVDGSWRFRINRQGFRDDRDYTYAKHEDRQRILVLGDSQAMGYENDLDDTFPFQLGVTLRSRGVPAEIMNTGVAGFGTAEELAFLENEGLHYRPDAVVLMFYRNDYSDNVRSNLFALQGGTLVARSRQYAPGTAVLERINDYAFIRWLSQHSYSYSLLFNFAWNTLKNASIRSATDPNERVVTAGAIPPSQKRLASALLARMQATLMSHNIPLLVIDVPEVPLSGRVGFRPSFDADMQQKLQARGFCILSSEAVLAGFEQGATFHRPHGERHVIEVVHAAFALRAAAEIERSLNAPEGATQGATQGAAEQLSITNATVQPMSSCGNAVSQKAS